MQDPNELVEILQTAISPVVLVSGIGLLILSMTNRFGRTTDRLRSLIKQINQANYDHTERIAAQIRILYWRSRLLLLAISFALASVLFVSLLVVTLFSIYLLGLGLEGVVVGLFIISLMCLVTSVLLFIQDMSLSLKALREELRGLL
ncbi:MAG: DUF2721 domain-containing protein [Synechococcales bacterium]|nr:DUF2721 domain-containing protein [Synechococcales bacterium]